MQGENVAERISRADEAEERAGAGRDESAGRLPLEAVCQRWLIGCFHRCLRQFGSGRSAATTARLLCSCALLERYQLFGFLFGFRNSAPLTVSVSLLVCCRECCWLEEGNYIALNRKPPFGIVELVAEVLKDFRARWDVGAFIE